MKKMEQKKLKGKAEFLGWGFVSGAYGPVISITRCLLDGCRLVMWTDAGIWYMENNDIKETAENFGVGLRLVELREVKNERIEAIEPHLNIGDEVIVKVVKIDEKGRVNLTLKGVTEEDKASCIN